MHNIRLLHPLIFWASMCAAYPEGVPERELPTFSDWTLYGTKFNCYHSSTACGC